MKIFDSYRPHQAVDNFVRWAKNNNRKMKSSHYPNVKKIHLFKEGYIASKSGHTRGSTVDITIIDLNNGKELDMGTIYDYFGKESWIEYTGLTVHQRKNRLLLQSVMNKYGFKSVCYGHAGDGNLHVNIIKGEMSDEDWEEVDTQ